MKSGPYEQTYETNPGRDLIRRQTSLTTSVEPYCLVTRPEKVHRVSITVSGFGTCLSVSHGGDVNLFLSSGFRNLTSFSELVWGGGRSGLPHLTPSHPHPPVTQ